MPTPPHHGTTSSSSDVSYRAALLLARWSRRTREQALQAQATALGRDGSLRSAFRRLRNIRQAQLQRWHKQKSAELHRWRSLMRLVIAAWRGWHLLLQIALARRAAALQSRADRLCRWTFEGWQQFIHDLWRERGSLIHYASVLQQRCLCGWAQWLEARRAKRPMRARLARLGVQRVKRAALRQWEASAERRARALLARCGAARLASDASLERALCRWRAARLRSVRAALLQRRAYLFMGTRLLGRLVGAWRGLVLQRQRLDAFCPHAQRRLTDLRLALRLGRWKCAVATLRAAAAVAQGRRGCVQAAGARAAARSLFAYHRTRAHKLSSLCTAAAAVRRRAAAAPWTAWKVAYAKTTQGRHAAIALRRGLRRWAGRVARLSAYALRLGAAAELDARALCGRVVGGWRSVASMLALHRQTAAVVLGRSRTRALSAGLRALEEHASFAALRDDAAREGTRRVCRAGLLHWRRLTLASEVFEVQWRRAVRCKYRYMARRVLGGWRRLLAERHEQWGVVLEAEARLASRRRANALRTWRELACDRADKAERANAHARALRLRRGVPAWRAGAAYLESRRCLRRLATRHAQRHAALAHVRAWREYSCCRVARRVAKAERLACLLSSLAAGTRGRVYCAWKAWHLARMAQNAALAASTATFRWRVQTRALWQLQRHTVLSRLRMQSARASALHASHASRRRGLTSWRAASLRRRLALAAAGRADALRRAALVRSCWGGLLRYHHRQRLKAAMVREAFAAHRASLAQAGVAQWVSVGLARHEMRLQAAAACSQQL